MLRLPGILFLVTLFIAGCQMRDLTAGRADPAPLCEVHHTPMHPEIVRASSGESVYLPEYTEAAQTRFPHHGGAVLNGERANWPLIPELSDPVRDFVCPECNQAQAEYLHRKPANR